MSDRHSGYQQSKLSRLLIVASASWVAMCASVLAQAKDQADPFLGRFVGERLKILSRRSGDEVHGELVDGERRFDFTGKVVNGKLRANFKVDDLEASFNATVDGDVMTVFTGTSTHKLRRYDASSVADKVRVSVSMIVKTPNAVENSIVLSQDNARVAFVEGVDGQHRVAVNDKRYQPSFRIALITFSSDAQRLGYLAQRQNKKWSAVVDGQAGPAFDRIDARGVQFSDDGKRFAYLALRGESFHVVIDGKESLDYQSAGAIAFSDQGGRVAYIAKYAGKWHAIVDGKAGPGYDGIGPVVFSPDGKRVAYTVLEGSVQRLVVDGDVSKTYEAISLVRFSPNSKRIAFGVVQHFREQIVVDGKAGPLFDQSNHFAFSPDSQRTAYRASRNGKRFIMINQKPGDSFDDVGEPVFSPDSRRVAFKIKERDLVKVVVNGEKSKTAFDAAFALTFSPDSKRLAYIARRGENWFVVTDGKASSPYDSILRSGVVFSPDSEHVVFGALRDGNRHIVVDGVASPIKGRFLAGSRVVFDSVSQFHTLVRDGDRFDRVDGKILR